MRCPKCNNNKTSCLDSRQRMNGNVHRRRACPKCDHRFSTTEVQVITTSHKTLMEDRIAARAKNLAEGLINDLRNISAEVR